MTTYLTAQNINCTNTHFVCSGNNLNIEDSIKIDENDFFKYKEAFNYILSDSINLGKEIFVSDTIIDMDRFYFKDEVKDDTTLTNIIDSLTKYTWFENFSSDEIQNIFGKQNKSAESILFFSLIEKNTLRADLFFERKSLNEFKYNNLSNYNVNEIFSYLFFFDEFGKIKKAYRAKMIYEM